MMKPVLLDTPEASTDPKIELLGVVSKTFLRDVPIRKRNWIKDMRRIHMSQGLGQAIPNTDARLATRYKWWTEVPVEDLERHQIRQVASMAGQVVTLHLQDGIHRNFSNVYPMFLDDVQVAYCSEWAEGFAARYAEAPDDLQSELTHVEKGLTHGYSS